ncbi:MAG: DUF3352 domain-containing protein [Chloroflexi bacterium]|nr:MAG: DUF3352 domain-containing protein [Chloroflexota bacterium]
MNQSSFDKATREPNRLWLLIAGCLGLFVCICTIAIAGVLFVPAEQFTTLRQLLGLSSAEVGAIEYAPASAPVFAVVNPNFGQLSSFAKLKAIFDKNPAYAKRLSELVQQSAASTSGALDFQRDVQPWIGAEIALVLLDAPVVGSSTPPNLVLIAATRDKTKSDEALARIRKQAEDGGATFTEEVYKGVKIVAGHSRTASSALAYAAVQNQVLIGTSADALKKLIDTKQSGDHTNLASSAVFQRVMAQLPKDRAASLYVDLHAMAQSAPQSASADVSALQGAGLALSFTDDGVRLDYVSAYDLDKAAPAFKQVIEASQPTTGAVFEHLPVSSILSVAGQNLRAFWNYYRDVASRDPATSSAIDNMQKQTGIDLDADVFAWMTGAYALGIVPAKPLEALGPTAPGVGALLLFEAKDMSVVKSKLDKIAGVLAQQGLVFTKRTVNGVDVQVLSGAEGLGLTVGYGFLGNYLVLASADDVLTTAVDATSAPLSKDAEFLQSTKPQLQPRSSLTFVSLPRLIEAIKPTLSRSQLNDFQVNSEPLLKPFKSVSFSAGIPKDNVQAGMMFIHIAE